MCVTTPGFLFSFLFAVPPPPHLAQDGLELLVFLPVPSAGIISVLPPVCVLLSITGRTRPCTHECTAVAVYRQTGHAVGEALVGKKKESRRSGVSAESGVEKEY